MFFAWEDADALGFTQVAWDDVAEFFWRRERRKRSAWAPAKAGPKFGSVAGERNPAAKLTYSDAAAIRRSNEPLRVLLARFPAITMATIKRIRSGRIWKDAGPKVVRGPKIPPELVPDVVRRAEAGEKQRDIAASLGVSQGLVWKTIRRARAESTRAA